MSDKPPEKSHIGTTKKMDDVAATQRRRMFETRLLILRLYILDTSGDRSSALSMDTSAKTYITYNATEALKLALSERDEPRGVTRRIITKHDLPIGEGEDRQKAYARLQVMCVAGEFVEISEKEFYTMAALDNAGEFEDWFITNFVDPLVKGEDQELKVSGGKEIWQLNKLNLYFDQIAETFRMKTWEVIYCPAKLVPKTEEATA